MIYSSLWTAAEVFPPHNLATLHNLARPHNLATPHNLAVQAASPTHWASLNVALINSIRNGVFFDRKYWVRHSKAGDVLKPIYFSSIIMNDKAQQLNDCASKSDYRRAETLTASSGQIPQGPKHSRKRS